MENEITPRLPLNYSEHFLNIAWGIILSLLTCGIYNLYWNYRQFNSMNTLMGRHEYDFFKWLILTLITCGLFHIYYEYKMGGDLTNCLRAYGHRPPDSLQLIALGVSLMGLTIVADAIFQHELNRLCLPEQTILPPMGTPAS